MSRVKCLWLSRCLAIGQPDRLFHAPFQRAQSHWHIPISDSGDETAYASGILLLGLMHVDPTSRVQCGTCKTQVMTVLPRTSRLGPAISRADRPFAGDPQTLRLCLRDFDEVPAPAYCGPKAPCPASAWLQEVAHQSSQLPIVQRAGQPTSMSEGHRHWHP